MSDTNQVRLAYAKESTFKTAPTGTYQIARTTGESLRMDSGFTQSNEIRSDRQTPDVLRNSFIGAGDFNWELPYGAHDSLYQAALMSDDWTTEDDDLAGAANVSVDGSGDFLIASGSWSTTPSVGDWLEVRGFTNAANNGYHQVTAATSTTITTVATLTTESAAAGTIDQLGYIQNGTTLSTWSFEKKFSDLSNIYTLLTGFAVQTFNMNIATGAINTGSFGFIGGSQSMTTSDVGSAYTAANSNSVTNAIDNIDSILEGDASYDMTQFSFSYGNQLRGREQIGTLGPVSIGSGQIALTGTHQAYFETVAVMNKYLAGTESSVAAIVEDSAGNGYIFDVPAIKYNSGQVVASGANGDVLADMAWTAKRDSTYDYTMRISRFTA